MNANTETAIEISKMNKKLESLTSYIESMGFPKAGVKMLGRQEASSSDQLNDSGGFNDMNEGQEQKEVQAMGFQGQGNNPYSNANNNNNTLNPQPRNQEGGNNQGGYRQRETQGGASGVSVATVALGTGTVAGSVVILGKMKKELKRKYLADNYRQDIFLKINNFRQRDLSVAGYTAEFNNLMLKGDVAEPEEQSMACYLGGLNYEISNVVQLQPYWSLNDVCKLALKVEKQQKEMRSRGSKYGSREGFTNKGGTSSSKPTAATKTNTKVSTSKGEGVVSKQQQQSSYSNTNSRRCFKCQGLRHITSKCPNHKIISLVEEDSDEDDIAANLKEDEYVNEDVVEDVTYGDKGASLVIQRSLSVVREEEEEYWG
ncbi:hypothetical protein LWI29_028221 [Acer saccharum]|uniref:Retrotransposon gag domain-containing protein n=1 Tax=Acer saccharum TaxID=4024 RepID=A0AA39VAW3_ACESA|nr:hypothetical protein LWI29_028221 [Acer saccharum]